MSNNELNTDFRTFLIKFIGSYSQYITQDLPATISKYDDSRGIDFIKIYDNSSNKFKRANRKEIIKYHKSDDNLDVIINHSYFN